MDRMSRTIIRMRSVHPLPHHWLSGHGVYRHARPSTVTHQGSLCYTQQINIQTYCCPYPWYSCIRTKNRYSSTHEPQHLIEASGHLHVPAALPPGKNPPYNMGRRLDRQQSWCGQCGGQTNLFSLQEIYPQIQGVPGFKITTSGFNSRADSESKMSYIHGSNSQRFGSYEFLKYSK